jgi:hypothetical protein
MASLMTASAFVALVAAVAFLAVVGLRRAAAPSLLIAFVATAYLLVPAVLAYAGALDRYNPLPAPALVMIAILTVVTVATCLAPIGARIAQAVGLAWLVAFQVFRVPVELLLHRLYQEGVVPVQMTYAGRNFDIVTGISAALLGWWLLRHETPPRVVVLGWNLLGLALLANIVTIAMLSAPVPFRAFLETAPHTLPSLFPFVWLPSFLVQMALAGHLLVFRMR